MTGHGSHVTGHVTAHVTGSCNGAVIWLSCDLYEYTYILHIIIR